MSSTPLYVASPLGFNEPGRRYLDDVLHPRLRAAGFAVLDPWAAGRAILEEQTADDATLNARLGEQNRSLITSSAGMLAVLDGADVDSGTAAEIGFAAGIGRPVVGLRTDFRLAGDNLAAPVNLQVLDFLAASGGRFVTTLDDALQELRERLGADDGASLLYHLTERERFARARDAGAFDESTLEQTLEEVGFIHCSFLGQIPTTAARFYAHLEPSTLVCLAIDPERLESPVRVEEAGGGARFPHVYGPINLDAVVAVRPVVLTDGRYGLGPARGPDS